MTFKKTMHFFFFILRHIYPQSFSVYDRTAFFIESSQFSLRCNVTLQAGNEQKVRENKESKQLRKKLLSHRIIGDLERCTQLPVLIGSWERKILRYKSSGVQITRGAAATGVLEPRCRKVRRSKWEGAPGKIWNACKLLWATWRVRRAWKIQVNVAPLHDLDWQ